MTGAGRRNLILMAVLVAGCAGAAGLYRAESGKPPYAPPAGPVVAASVMRASSSVQLAPVERVPKTAYAEVYERTIFHPSRHPPVPEAKPKVVKKPPPPKPPPTFPFRGHVLVGTVIAKTQAFALLKSPRSGEIVQVSLGQEVHGWSVERINRDSVVFKYKKGTERIEFRKASEPTNANQRGRGTYRRH